MTLLPSLVGNMIANLLILVGLTYLLSRLIAAWPALRGAAAGALYGIALGAIAILLMSASYVARHGLVMDLRGVVLLIAGLTGGPVAALVAAALTALARLWLAGNVTVAVIGIGASAVLGVAARMVGRDLSIRWLLLLGVALTVVQVSLPAVAFGLTHLNEASARDLIGAMLPAVILVYPLGVVVMGWLLRFEGERVVEAADLKSTNLQLAERDAQFQAVFGLSTVAMIWASPEGQILRANKAMADLVGYPVETLEGMSYGALLPPEDQDGYLKVLAAEAANALNPPAGERRYVHKDGRIVYALRSVTIIRSPAGEPLYKFLMMQDITERKQAEERIRFQAELLDSVEQAVIATDMSGAIVMWNRCAEGLSGWPAGAVIGQSIAKVVPSIVDQFDPANLRAFVKVGRGRSSELTVQRADGTTFLAQITTSPVRDDKGKMVGVVAVAVDITKERRSQLALLEERRTLAILNRTAAKLNAELELTDLLQAVTDASVELTGARFGALYSSQRSETGYHLYALSGIDQQSFDALPMPGVTELFSPVLDGAVICRWDDITRGESFDVPGPEEKPGCPVRSLLAVPLLSRSGDVTGALFFGHEDPCVFSERSERIMEGIASHASIAIEKASLFHAAQQEIETRKRAEESLNKSEARFRDFAEIGSDLLWETDEASRITSIVGDARSVFGYSEQELLGKTPWDFARADPAGPDWRQHVEDHLARRPFRNFEYQLADRSGGTRWISTNGRPYFDLHGRFHGFRGVSTNIAARKHAEAKLASSAKQQQAAAVLSQLALQRASADDLYQVAAELVSRTLGVELVGVMELSPDKRVLKLRAGCGWPSQAVNIRAVPLDYCPPLARGVTSDVPVHFSRRNFNLIPGLQNDKGSGVVVPIGEKTERRGVLVVCSEGFRAFGETDINFLRAISYVLAADAEQRKAETTLRLRDRALEAIGEGIMITDTAQIDNPLIYVNPAFERITGYSKEEVVGHNARLLQGPESDSSVVDAMRTAVESEETYRGSILNYRKDGSSFWNAITISPIRARDGSTTQFVGILSDETRRVELEAQLRQAQKMESLGHLTGGVAHDFNNLLAVILGNSEILHEEIDDPELKTIAELVMSTAEKGADLTQRLLAFGRRQALHPEPLDLGKSIESLTGMLNRTLGNHTTLETHANAVQRAYVDRGLFESAILNLVLNARDAMPQGGLVAIKTDVVHRTEGPAVGLAPGDYVTVTVTDTGTGMTKEVLERALDPFFTTKGVGKGSGMGLPMVYGFAKQSGGHVSIESQVGAGTSVCLYLPVAKSGDVAAPSEPEHDGAAEGGHEKILVVEDEPQVRKFVSSQLTSLGYDVLEAEAGAPALDILRADPKIDLLFTDLIMPGGMSGFDLVQHAREMKPQLRVLLTTGYADETDSRLADIKEPILKKPYKRQQLAHALRSVLELRA